MIRTARRDKSQSRTVRLSNRAYARLHEFAKRDGLTLSAVIERYLSEAATTPAIQAARTNAVKQLATVADADSTQVAVQAPPAGKVMQVRLWLRVENNNKFVRGKKKAREEIKRYVLGSYGMQQPHKDRPEYLLSIPYQTDEEFDRIIEDILTEAANIADYHHCFIEADVQSVDDLERSW